MFFKVACLKLFQIWIWVYQYEKNLSLRWSSWWQTLESLPWPAFSPAPRSRGHRAGRRWVSWKLLLSPPPRVWLVRLILQHQSAAALHSPQPSACTGQQSSLNGWMQRTSWCVMVFRNHCPCMLLLCSSSIYKGLQWKMWAWVEG